MRNLVCYTVYMIMHIYSKPKINIYAVEFSIRIHGCIYAIYNIYIYIYTYTLCTTMCEDSCNKISSHTWLNWPAIPHACKTNNFLRKFP